MKRQVGFTLIELMVTLAVFAIMVTFAIPSFREFIQNNRLISQANDMISILHLARSEAVKRRVTITVCGSSDAATCNTSNWEQGLIVFTDTDADGVIDAGVDELLRVNGTLKGSNTMRTAGFANTGRVQYRSDGSIDSSGTFKICDTRAVTFARAINVGITGRTRSATNDGGNPEVNGSDGSDITCP